LGSRCALTTGRSKRSAKPARRPKPNAINKALISIGTNSTRLLVLNEAETLAVESRGTRLGTGLQHAGRLDPDARERTLAAIADYMLGVREHEAAIACIATSVMRRAADGDDFTAAVRALTGVEPHVLSGDEEATYSFLGATQTAGGDEPVAVLDVGGGSTELAIDVPATAQQRRSVGYTCSVEIGAVRLAERHPLLLGARALAPAERAEVLAAAGADAAAVLEPFASAPRPTRLIVVGGSAFTAAAMVAKAPLRDGVTMDPAQRAELLDDLLSRDLDARKALPFIRPQRADILPAGLAIIDEACRILAVPNVIVSVDDLLAGYLASDAYGVRAASA
jgi:exopolyphosphatase / guanosine-5'-triphosphate,3'-diphosphate pyrophosphatase